MNTNHRWLLSALIAVSSATYGLNPVQGWYGGVMLGVSATPTTSFSFITPFRNVAGTGSLSYSVLGNVGLQLGYRCNKLRFELEGDYNNNPFDSLTINNRVITSSTSTTTESIQGNLQVASLLLNTYLDIYGAITSDTSNESNFVPFVGIGLGGAYVQNNIQLNYNQIQYGAQSGNVSGGAGQAMVGLNYFMDDFTTFGFDARFFTTFSKSAYLDTRTQVYSVNISFNGSFSGA